MVDIYLFPYTNSCIHLARQHVHGERRTGRPAGGGGGHAGLRRRHPGRHQGLPSLHRLQLPVVSLHHLLAGDHPLPAGHGGRELRSPLPLPALLLASHPGLHHPHHDGHLGRQLRLGGFASKTKVIVVKIGGQDAKHFAFILAPTIRTMLTFKACYC